MAKQDRYAELADKIVDLLGGKSNISFFAHCITRLRFNVKDKGLVRVDEIEKLPGAMGAQWSGDQLQVIIGQAVSDAYDAICEKYGLERQEVVEENLDEAKKSFSINAVFEAIAACITPLVAILVGAGLLKIIVLVLEQFGILVPGDPTDTVLTFVGDAGFYFLPIFVGAAAARRFKANMGLGMLIGAMLIHPSFIAAVSEGTALSVFGLPIYSATYSSTIIPVIMAVWIMAPIERFIAKHSPDIVRSVTEPLFTLLIMIPITLCAVAPLGAFLGTYLAQGIMWFYSVTGPLGVAVIAAILPWIIMTGMHSALVPYGIATLAELGRESVVIPAMLISNINQGIASFAVAFKAHDAQVKATAISCGFTALVGGITEPAMYGVNLKYRTPMYAAMIGSFCGGLVAAFGGASTYVISGSKGLFGLPAYIGPDPMNLVWICAGVGIGAAVTFIATFVLYKPSEE